MDLNRFLRNLGFFSFSPFPLRVPNDDCAAESDSAAISSWIWADTEWEWYHREDMGPIAGTSEASQCWGCTLLWASHSRQSKKPHPFIAQDYLYVERKGLILHKGVFGTSSFLDKFPICFQTQFQYHLWKNSSLLIRSNITPFLLYVFMAVSAFIYYPLKSHYKVVIINICQSVSSVTELQH